MKAMPFSAGIAEKNASNASTPPADAPIPTTGKLTAITVSDTPNEQF